MSLVVLKCLGEMVKYILIVKTTINFTLIELDPFDFFKDIFLKMKEKIIIIFLQKKSKICS